MTPVGPLGSGATLERLGVLGVVAVVRSPTSADALAVSRLLLGAGIGGVEITWTTPSAAAVVRTLREDLPAGVLLGAGSLRSTADTTEATAAGADFLVSAGSPPALLPAMLDTGRLALPGVCTPTEIMAATDAGAVAVKLFPALLHGPSGLAALGGPFPDVAFVPTGGIGLRDVDAWFAAGAHAVGLGSALAPATLADAESARQVEKQARALVASMRRRPC